MGETKTKSKTKSENKSKAKTKCKTKCKTKTKTQTQTKNKTKTQTKSKSKTKTKTKTKTKCKTKTAYTCAITSPSQCSVYTRPVRTCSPRQSPKSVCSQDGGLAWRGAGQRHPWPCCGQHGPGSEGPGLPPAAPAASPHLCHHLLLSWALP